MQKFRCKSLDAEKSLHLQGVGAAMGMDVDNMSMEEMIQKAQHAGKQFAKTMAQHHPSRKAKVRLKGTAENTPEGTPEGTPLRRNAVATTTAFAMQIRL